MVAQLSVDDLYCNAAGLPSPTGDGIVDTNIENIKNFNDQGPTLGIGLCSGSPTRAVIMSNPRSAPHELDTRTHAHRPAKRVGGYFEMRNSPDSGTRFVGMLM